jgi:hypothetical protein
MSCVSTQKKQSNRQRCRLSQFFATVTLQHSNAMDRALI